MNVDIMNTYMLGHLHEYMLGFLRETCFQKGVVPISQRHGLRHWRGAGGTCPRDQNVREIYTSADKEVMQFCKRVVHLEEGIIAEGVVLKAKGVVKHLNGVVHL